MVFTILSQLVGKRVKATLKKLVYAESGQRYMHLPVLHDDNCPASLRLAHEHDTWARRSLTAMQCQTSHQNRTESFSSIKALVGHPAGSTVQNVQSRSLVIFEHPLLRPKRKEVIRSVGGGVRGNGAKHSPRRFRLGGLKGPFRHFQRKKVVFVFWAFVASKMPFRSKTRPH